MKFGIEPPYEPAKAQTNVKRFAFMLGTGFVGVILTAAAETGEDSRFVVGLLVVIVAAISLFILGSAVPMTREPSLRRLSLIALGALVTPLGLGGILEAIHIAPGFDDAGSWGLLYFALSCFISGISLLIVAGVRFALARRKNLPSRSSNPDSSPE